MNVYDFDNTLLRGDSTARFFAWCLRRCPRMWPDLPGQAVNGLMYVLRLRPKQAAKQRMFRFLRYINVERELQAFWQVNLSRVKGWYRATQRPDDVVISASPEFLVRPACEAVGIRWVMASPVDMRTGVFSGPNCHGPEKVRRFRERWPDAAIDEFYSDSLSDQPLAALAKRAWLVKGDRLLPWPGEK